MLSCSIANWPANRPKVDWYMEKLPTTSADLCVAASLSKTVTRADQAFFKAQTSTLEAAVVSSQGGSKLKIILVGEKDGPGVGYLESRTHALFNIKVSCLVPVSDIEAKLEKEVKDKQNNIEKTMRILDLNLYVRLMGKLFVCCFSFAIVHF